ncbi:hypothetical protein BN1012_Phect2063 [Candidatus Phaeomarinobacter ectocarpi]|uniref:Uncharacterized protein n=1 Tax=Candidatus Phaeomarinibacter ectocarpi TaxID=1458461 RepID=X5MNP3_9HYPH|nr:hypothetical protein BN1012_Phect2063 [Candidatus Phaeomarinobacter ectocarpi]
MNGSLNDPQVIAGTPKAVELSPLSPIYMGQRKLSELKRWACCVTGNAKTGRFGYHEKALGLEFVESPRCCVRAHS